MRKLVKQRLLFLDGSNKRYEVLEQHNDRILEQKVPPRRQKLGTEALYKTKKSVGAIKINNV